jgi:hypothetical protein
MTSALEGFRLLSDYEAKMNLLQSSSSHLRALLGLCATGDRRHLDKLGSVVQNAHEAVSALDNLYNLLKEDITQ